MVTGLRCLPFEDGAVDEIAAGTSPSLVVGEISDQAAVGRLRSLSARAPMHVYLAGVRAADHELIGGASRLCSGSILLLPAGEQEVRNVMGHGLRRLRQAEMGRRLDRGTRRRVVEIELRTRDVYVSETARRLAKVLREGGFAQNGEEEDLLSVAVEEALVNAIEHGNLDLDSSLRPDAVGEEDRYEKLKASRLKDPEYGDRLVRLSVCTDPEVATVSIRDEGQGFDAAPSRDDSEPGKPSRAQIMSVSGKGMGMIGRAFDEVRYERNGTQIILQKRKDG